MSLTSLGDLAQTFLLQRRNTALKADIQRLGSELSSGQTGDISEHLSGNYSRLSQIERDMRVLNGYRTTQSELTQLSSSMQSALEYVRNETKDLSQSLLVGSQGHVPASQGTLAADSRAKLETIISTLNAQTAGRSAFAGDSTDQAALADADTILGALSTAVAGATDAATAIAAVDNWFADPAGFATVAYLGSTTSRAATQISDTAHVAISTRADDPEIRDTIKAVALAALAGEAGFPLSGPEANNVLKDAGNKLISAQEGLISTQARLGFAQEQLQDWTVRTKTEIAGLEYAKGALLSVDPYETATRLQAAQAQLEGLYSVTVRLSKLSLVNFLR